VTWQGRFRSALADAAISPRPVQAELPVWLGVGGNPESALRAARLGLPLALANISQKPEKFAAQIADYKRVGVEAGFGGGQATGPPLPPTAMWRRIHKPRATCFYPYYSAYFGNHAPKTSYLADVPREQFEARAAPDGPIFVGSPQEIVDKIMRERELFGHQRFLAQVDIGGLPYAKVAESIELLGRRCCRGCNDFAKSNGGSAHPGLLHPSSVILRLDRRIVLDLALPTGFWSAP